MKRLSRWRRAGHQSEAVGTADAPQPFDVALDDPLLLYLQASPRTVVVRDLELQSPALAAMRDAGTEVVVPLVAQGELVGVLNLGARRSERPYSAEDCRLLDNLASSAAAGIRVAQLVRRQEAAVKARARIDQELRVAHQIQQQFLPQDVPNPPGWSIAPFYRAAREVGGDFYDFIPLPEGRLGLVVGDVTDKGVPAAMVMATTHSILRTDAPRLVDPGAVLARANDLLCAEMPPNMFVTCLYAVLEPATGRLVFANAGHNLPCIRTAGGVVDPKATGMPLGLMPGMAYDEREVTLELGETLLLYSDGVVEAHDPHRELFGFPRLRSLMATVSGTDIVAATMAELERFTGAGWEQEDDITLVAIHRSATMTTLDSFDVASLLGNERTAAERVATVAAGVGLLPDAVDRLRTASAEAIMNGIEHGNECRADVPVSVWVGCDEHEVVVRVVDAGGGTEIDAPETPDIDAKLAGLQSPRGWGMFLMKRLVDRLDVRTDGVHRTVELRMSRSARRPGGDPQ